VAESGICWGLVLDTCFHPTYNMQLVLKQLNHALLEAGVRIRPRTSSVRPLYWLHSGILPLNIARTLQTAEEVMLASSTVTQSQVQDMRHRL